MKFDHLSVEAAAKSACVNIENNLAAPVSIIDNGVEIWRNTGVDSYEVLRNLAGVTDGDF